MKVLVISEVFPTLESPQYGVFIKQQMDAFCQLGNEYEVIIPVRGNTNEYKLTEIYKGVSCIKYKPFRYDLLSNIACGCFVRAVKEYSEGKGFDLIAIHIVGDSILKSVISFAKTIKVPVVTHYHGLNVWTEFTTKHPLREKYYALRREKSLENVDGVVCVSEKVSAIIRERLSGIPIYTVYNGVNTELFSSQEHKEHCGALRISAVGNLIPIKGFKYLIQSVCEAKKLGINTRVEIVGDGFDKIKLQDLCKRLKVNETVTFHGKLPYDKVAQIMRESDLFILPSYYEALGCVYLEAMACGIPAVGVRGMGIDEIIIDGENGFLVKPKSVEDIVSVLCRVQDNPELLSNLGARARETAHLYTWDNSAKVLKDAYENCLKKVDGEKRK